IERDLRPIFINNADVGGFIDRYPRANSGWSGDHVGDFYVGAKVNLLSEYRQNPAAVAVRGLVKVPTGDKDVGNSTGQADFAIDVIASKEAAQRVEVAGYGGYEFRGKPDDFDIPGGVFRLGAGAGFPSRSPVRLTADLNGNIVAAEPARLTGTPLGTHCRVPPSVSNPE